MNVDPVLIDDDDVDMEPVVILDDDDENMIGEKSAGTPSVSTAETIILDDESPILTGQTVKKNAASIINNRSLKKSEASFVKNLKNNRLMDKIVRRCINMENATGMPRVVYKTMLPLYRDTNNTFKQSGSFRALLKNTYKLLMRDPDHKFLHIKTLCEELKSGGLRRKVPFVTLATNLKNNGSQWDHEELTSSSRQINQNNTENGQIDKIYTNNKKTRKKDGYTQTKRKEKKSKSCAVNTKGRIKTRSIALAEKEKTDIINLDDSDTDSVDRSANDDGRNDVIIIEETEPSDQRNDNVNTVLQKTLEAVSKNGNQVVQETLEAESKKGSQVVRETLEAYSNKENKVVQETIEEGYDSGTDSVDTSENEDGQNDVIMIGETENDKVNVVIQETLQSDSNKKNKVVHETIEVGSNKENNYKNGKLSDKETDYELLIPKTHVGVLPIQCEVSHDSTNDLEIARLEKQIAIYKRMIDKLEEAEVNTESCFASPYYLCSKYKENVVSCYKQICELKGNCKDIVKRREIRLIVAEGHPPGPAKRLEHFLNSTIDRTGAVEFPDFSDVVQCVHQANLWDKLAWNRQQVIQEAVALFRQCGQALRKRRQMREYRDLLSLIRDKDETDDPAEKDPILLAKLEENKLIAKIKEEQILERYVSMENNASQRVGIPQVGNAVEFESDEDSSDSDSASEQNINLPSNIATSTINNQPGTGECSGSDINLCLLQANNIILGGSYEYIITFGNDHSDTGQSSKANDGIVQANPMLMNLLTAPITTQTHVEAATNESQYATGESSIMNNAISNNDSHMMPTDTRNFTPDTMHYECETIESSDQEEIDNSKLELTIAETVVGFNNATANSDMRSVNNKNTEIPANNEPCNLNDVRDNVSSTTDGIEQNCDSSISKEGVEAKTEDNFKREPLDIQNMLDELGDGFECQVFDIEDPFLVIEISSDGFTDDDEL